MDILERRGFLVGFATLVFFSGLAADAWRNSISWYGYGALVAVIAGVAIAVLVRNRNRVSLRQVPLPLAGFVALSAASIAWSAYPAASSLGVIAQLITTTAALAIALLLTGEDIVRALSWALRGILALSLAFELVVSLVIRAPVLPVWATAADRADPPVILYWSRNNLLEGERIQGIVGSWSLLGMVAVLAVIVIGAQLATRGLGRVTSVLWIALAALTIVLTRSATIYLAIGATLVVLLAMLVIRRVRTVRARRTTYALLAVAIAAVASGGVLFRTPLLAALGKSPDLTGRLDIWNAVIELAQQRPIFGWGWVSFWAPWVEPFRDLVRKNGVMQLHAHNAWLDVWLQLGIVGVAVLGALVAITAVRSFQHAIAVRVDGSETAAPASSPAASATHEIGAAGTSRVRRTTDVGSTTDLDTATDSRGTAFIFATPLLLTALLVQSLAESRLLIEGGWLLLVVLAVTAKIGTGSSGQPERRITTGTRRTETTDAST